MLFLLSDLHREESEQVRILLHEKRRCHFLASAHTWLPLFVSVDLYEKLLMGDRKMVPHRTFS